MEREGWELRQTLVRRPSSFECVAWSPDGSLVAGAASDGLIWIWEAATGKVRQVLEGHKDAVLSVAWSPDGRVLASGGWDATVRLWEVATGKALQVLEGHTSGVASVAWSPDGRVLASGGGDNTVRLWEAATGKVRQVLEGHTLWVLSVAWSPDGRVLASGGRDNTVRLWEAATGKVRQVLEGHTLWVLSVAWSPDGRVLASGGWDATVRLWEAATGKVRQVLEGHTLWVLSVAWSPDGRVLASGGWDATVRLWEAATGKVRQVLEGHTNWVQSVAWSPDGRVLASGGMDNTVRLWEAATGKALQVLEGHTSGVASVAWSPDGRVLASGGRDATVRLWEAATGKGQVLEGHTDVVQGVAWSADGWLASMSERGEVRVWAAPRGGWARKVIQPPPFQYAGAGICFLPAVGVKPSLGEEEILVRACGLQELLRAAEAPREVQLASAKVVLVGDSDVGKSCLALRLAEDKYEERGTTHGMQIWPIAPEKLDPAAAAPQDERREVFLWDLGGQPEYRLVHQLFLQDTTLALLLCEATRGEAAFQQVRDWNESLEARLRGRSATKLLVRTKLDQGGVVDLKEIERLKRECGFSGYYELSAKEGTKLPEFRRALSEALHWDQVTRVSRPLLFQQIRERVDKARSGGQVVLYYQDMNATSTATRERSIR